MPTTFAQPFLPGHLLPDCATLANSWDTEYAGVGAALVQRRPGRRSTCCSVQA